jgi:hypothetical protein
MDNINITVFDTYTASHLCSPWQISLQDQKNLPPYIHWVTLLPSAQLASCGVAALKSKACLTWSASVQQSLSFYQ